MNKRRALKLAIFLEKIPARKFNLSIIVLKDQCDTTACAMGWMPKVFPHLCRWEYGPRDKPVDIKTINGKIFGAFDTAEVILDIDFNIACFLFMDTAYNTKNRTAKCVAKRIRDLVKGKITYSDVLDRIGV